ncbi:zinc finger protein DZIP1 [Agrilus planipennis]|uniref:Zinc finger protein DZIP1 n=1 Tax=Agrilus planipennis TaxID=224129 RepID=A0A1W4W903_AGRPL|nr:zinc finger protein DZIP1 [Agrilus planipennis]
MWSESYDWHFDYPRLAFDAGFSFKSRKTKTCFEKEYIKNVDIGKLIQDRNTSTVEKYIPSVIEYSLDNDQTSILDPTFLKIFQLSQLAVEYLLFCKKYLDNTVVILKKGILSNTEEIADLKHELQQKDEEIELLETKIKSSKLQYHTYKDDASAFQCSLCCKVFATREFLEAHNKRRHQELNSTSAFQQETDKLQTEIKQLKERLNTTEKLVHKNDYPKRELLSPNEISINDDKKLINELQQKFELLKVYVEGELKTLQFQSSDQSKYEKWFEVFLQRLESLMQKSYTASTETDKTFQNQLETNKVDAPIRKTDSSVQTEENFVIRNVCERCEARNKEKSDFSRNQTQIVGKMLTDLKVTTESQLNSLEFALTEKVNNSLEKLDRQIRDLNKKVDEMIAKSHAKVDNIIPKSSNDYNHYSVVPVPKKRQFISGNKVNKTVEQKTKEPNKLDASIHANKMVSSKPENSVIPQKCSNGFDQREHQNKMRNIVPKENENKRDRITTKGTLKKKSSSELVEKSSSTSVQLLFRKNPGTTNTYSTDEENSTSSENNEAVIKNDHVKIRPSTSTLGKRSITSLKAAALDKEVLQGLKKEVQNIFDKRLVAIGISPSTKGISHSVYEKALAAIHRERAEMAEKYPQYEKITGGIIMNLEDRMKSSSKENKSNDILNKNATKTEPPREIVKKFSQKSKGGSKNVLVTASRQPKTPKTSSSVSSSEEEEEKIVTEDIIKRLTKPNKNLQKSYQTYSDVVKQINEKMQKRELEKNNVHLLQDGVIDLQDTPNMNRNNSSSDTTDKKSTNSLSNSENPPKKEGKKEVKESEDKYAKMDVISIESFTEEIVEDRKEEDNLSAEEVNRNLAQEKIQLQPKSALKNLPTKLLPMKKKVFFDLKSLANVEQKEDPGGGGDTTSATSSIFDEIESLKEVKKTATKEKDSDFSDFNFSDIL